MEKRVVFLDGLDCPSCAARLEQAAQRLKGMKLAKVAFGPGTLTIEIDPAEFREDELQRLIGRFGLGIAAVMEGSS